MPVSMQLLRLVAERDRKVVSLEEFEEYFIGWMTSRGERVAGVPLDHLCRYVTQIAPVYWRELHHSGYTAAECVAVDMSYWREDGILANCAQRPAPHREFA